MYLTADTKIKNAAKDKDGNDAVNAIFAGEYLSLKANEIENNKGELLSQGSIYMSGGYLLNNVGTIQATDDIVLKVDKIDNIGSVTGLNKYEIYYETWDGKILTQAEVEKSNSPIKWAFSKKSRPDDSGQKIGDLIGFENNAKRGIYESYLLSNYRQELYSKIRNTNSEVRSGTAQYDGIPLKGKLISKAVTTYANILAGKNILIESNELNNKDGKISAGERADITALTKLTNTTSLGNQIQLKDGHERIKWSKVKCGGGLKKCYPIEYERYFANGDLAYITGQASVIEANELYLATGSLILTPEIDSASQIINGSSTSGSGNVLGKDTKTGYNGTGTGALIIQKNMDTLTEIKASGVLTIDPLGAKSSLFTTTTDQTSKYLLETRSKYINLASFYGSDYFLSRLGYDESSEWNRARRLGDAYYEYLIVTRAISDKLGTRFINGLSDKELMKAMLDNSVDVQKDLQLTVGVSLTPSQVKALKSDIIWYEYEIVDGQKVLVPKVYLSQTTLATIEVDGRNKIGGLELTAINADELRNNGQLIGNGGATYINAGKVYNVTDTNELSEIRGNQVTVIATKGNIENIGGKISGIESVALVAENGDIINSSKKVTANYNNGDLDRTTHDSLWSIGEISSGGTTYIEGNNYFSEAGVLGGKDTIINVKDNVVIGSLTLKGDDKIGANSDNYEIYQSTKNIGGVVSTENLYITGNNLNIQGSTVAVSKDAMLNVKNINIESKVDSVYNELKNSSSDLISSKESMTKSYQEQNVEGQLFVGGSTLTNADINIIGSTFVTGDDSYLGGNVTVTSRELNGYYYNQEKKSGMTANFDVSSGGVSAGAGVRSTEDTIEINTKTQAMSNVILGHGTVVDGDKFDLTATNFQHGAIVINSSEVNYGATKNTYDEKQEHKETYIGISASISSPLLNRVDQMYDGVSAATKGNGTAGYVNGGVAVINSAVGTINGLANSFKTDSNDFYISASAGLSMSTQESKSHTYYEEAVVTTIRGLDENSSITYNNTNKITYEGTQSYGDTFIYNNVKEIEKKAVELKNYTDSSSSNTNAYAGTSMTSPSSVNFSVSGGNSNYTESGTSYQNGIFIGVNETYNNVGKLTLDGFEQYGGKVTGNIAEFEIKSKQNTSEINGSSSNYSAGTNTQIIGTVTDGKKGKAIDNDGISSWSAGGSTTNGSRTYVDTPSAFIIGEGSDLSIGKATNAGAIIGTEEGSNGKIKIKEYEGKDLKNSDTYNVTGGTVSTGGVGVEYQDKVKEGITHNTVIGNVEIETSTGDEINRDINNVQETTKDKDTGHFDFFVETGVLVLATKEGREQFTENVKLAEKEIEKFKEAISSIFEIDESFKAANPLIFGDKKESDRVVLGLILSENEKKEYAQLESEIDALLKSGEYDSKIEKIFGKEMVDKVKIEGIEALSGLTREEKAQLLTEFKSSTNKNSYESTKDKMQIFLSSSIGFSDKFYDIKGNMMVIAENIIMNDSVILKDGKPYSFKDAIYTENWKDMPIELKKDLIQQFNNIFYEKSNEYLKVVSQTENIDLTIGKKYGVNLSFRKMKEGDAGVYNGGNPQINTDFFDVKKIKDYDINWNETYSAFLGLTTTILHEGIFGHGFTSMMKDKNGKLKGTDFSIDLQILKSNYGTPMSIEGRYIFYKLEPDEATSFWSENLPEHIIKKVKGEK